MQRSSRSSPIQEAEAIQAKAARAELSQDFDAAFRLYIKAAELYIHLSRENDQDKTRLKAKASKALERAEKIKAFTEKSQFGQESITLTPVGVDYHSPQEQSYVLKKGERINGLRLPAWTEPTYSSSSSLFTDPDGQPSLSPEQRKVSPVWRRLSFSEAETPRLEAHLIRQNIVTDCSVCASVSVCLEHAQRFKSELVQSLMPKSTSAGRYDLRFLCNGTWRRIVVDDQLPYEPTTGKMMCMSCASPTSGPPIAWPSIIEKGYMKMMGGYDFPGSNSSIDLHAFIGWIPDQIEIQSPQFERENTWHNISRGFENGRCLFTLGTGQRDNLHWKNVELLKAHSYAVIDVQETEEKGRIVTVLDSWIRDGESANLLQIPWSDALNVFDGIYLSWDPKIWQQTLTFHGMWKVTKTDYCTRQLRLNFTGSERTSQDVWVLLTRHVVDSRQTSDFIALKVEYEDSMVRVNIPASVTVMGTYTNSSHVLVKTKIPRSVTQGCLSIFASYEGPSKEVGFTLNAYASDVAISWDTHIPNPPFTSPVEGSFTTLTAGGNPTHPSFMVNPQYHLQIHPSRNPGGGSGSGSRVKSNVSIMVQTAKSLPVNIAVVWSQGQRIFDLFQKDLAASSGAYGHGFVRLDQQLAVGDYTVILSTFQPNQLGSFSLEVQSSLPCNLTAIPQEYAGMYTRTVPGAWTTETAKGSPSFGQYSLNPKFQFRVSSPIQIKVRLQLIRPSSTTSINVTIYPASESLGLDTQITTSGGYDDVVSGVVTPKVSLQPGKYWIIPSTYDPGVRAEFRVLVYSSLSGLNVVPVPVGTDPNPGRDEGEA